MLAFGGDYQLEVARVLSFGKSRCFVFLICAIFEENNSLAISNQRYIRNYWVLLLHMRRRIRNSTFFVENRENPDVGILTLP